MRTAVIEVRGSPSVTGSRWPWTGSHSPSSRGDLRHSGPERRGQDHRGRVHGGVAAARLRRGAGARLDPLADRHRLRERMGVQLQETHLQDKLKVREALDLYASFYRTRRLARAARALGAGGKGGRAVRQALWRPAAAPVHRARPDRPPRPGVPRRAHLGARPGPAARHLGPDQAGPCAGVTVVLVSHFMDEVEELCDRVAILERGRIAALDTPAALVDRAGGEYRLRFRPMARSTSSR